MYIFSLCFERKVYYRLSQFRFLWGVVRVEHVSGVPVTVDGLDGLALNECAFMTTSGVALN